MLLSSVSDGLTAFVTSMFEKHGLIATVGIVATIMGGCCALTLAKVVDVFGRIEGFLFMLVVLILGVILKAACENVETYVAGHTLYWTGHVGLMYVIDVMLADMTTLRNRMIMFGINGTPTIASVFAGPKIADLFYTNSTFRWAFGAFTIIIAGVSIPVIVMMLWHQRKADKMGLLTKDDNGRTWYQSVWHYLIEFDGNALSSWCTTKILILCSFSCGRYPDHRNLRPYPPALQPRSICSKRLEHWLHHRNGGRRSRLPRSVLLLGEVPCSCEVPPMEIPQGAYHHRLLLAVWYHVLLMLVSIPLFCIAPLDTNLQ